MSSNPNNGSVNSRLEDAEIARLLKTVQAAQFRKSEIVGPKKDSSFKPRTLVEIAFAAEEKRQVAAEKKAREEQVQAEDTQPDEHTDEMQAEPSQTQQSDASEPLQARQQAEAGHSDDKPVSDADNAAFDAQQAQRDKEEAEHAEMMEAVRLQAEEAGYKKGFEAGLEAARAAEPTAEELAIEQERAQERADIINRLESVIAHATGPEAIDGGNLTHALLEMVSEIAQKRAGVAIADHPAGFIERIEGLVDKVKSGARTVVIKLNPDDLKAVQDWQQETSFPATWIFKEDSALGHGDIKMRLDGIFVTDQLCDTDQQSHVQMQVNIDDVADQLPSLDQRQAAAGAELETDELSQTGQEPEMNMPETAPDSSFEAGLEADAPSPFEIGLEGGSQEAAETGSQSPFAIGLEAVSAHLSDDETGSSETEFTSQGNLENALAFWETDNQDATPSISDFAADQPDEVFSNIADNLAENTEIDQTHQEGLADDPFAQGLESEESEHSDSLSSDEQPPEEPV